MFYKIDLTVSYTKLCTISVVIDGRVSQPPPIVFHGKVSQPPRIVFHETVSQPPRIVFHGGV